MLVRLIGSENVSPVRSTLPLLVALSVNVIMSPALGNELLTVLRMPTSGELMFTVTVDGDGGVGSVGVEPL